MNTFDEQSQPDQVDGTQDPQVSQEQPTQDSELQTPQPDQPVPTEAERQVSDSSELDAAPVQGQSAPSAPTNEEQQAAHDQRESERETQRREHSERTGGGSVNEGELQAQRDEHNARIAPGGGQL